MVRILNMGKFFLENRSYDPLFHFTPRFLCELHFSNSKTLQLFFKNPNCKMAPDMVPGMADKIPINPHRRWNLIILWHLSPIRIFSCSHSTPMIFFHHQHKWNRTNIMHLRRLALTTTRPHSSLVSISVSAGFASSNWKCYPWYSRWERRRYTSSDVGSFRRTYTTRNHPALVLIQRTKNKRLRKKYLAKKNASSLGETSRTPPPSRRHP